MAVDILMSGRNFNAIFDIHFDKRCNILASLPPNKVGEFMTCISDINLINAWLVFAEEKNDEKNPERRYLDAFDSSNFQTKL